jgi:hypothetical protein
MRRDLCRHGKAAQQAASMLQFVIHEFPPNRRRGKLARLP